MKNIIIAKLRKYFVRINVKPTPWAESHGISRCAISRCLMGKNISPKNAKLIADATDNHVTASEILYGEKK